MNYILGIDTTFHTTAVALIDDCSKIILDEREHIDIDDENADKFFNLHSKNLHHLLRPIVKKFIDQISLIAVSNQGGTFHSLPIGVNAANILAAAFGKKLIGISHEAGHLYSNWIGREENEFRFPIVSLNISAAHGNIWLIKNIGNIQKIKEIIWHRNPNQFSGLGAFFNYFFRHLGLQVKRKEGGVVFSDLASKGKVRELQEFQNIRLEDISGEVFVKNLIPIEKIIDNSRKYTDKEICDLAAGLSDRLFSLLAEKTINIATSYGAKEVHLSGGVGHDPILKEKMKDCCRYSIDFKAPLKPEYYFDNAVMVALAGYYQKKFRKPQDVLEVYPDEWHYRYYFNNCLKLS